ncbi:MAG: porin family protein [Bacteroidota bacterium]
MKYLTNTASSAFFPKALLVLTLSFGFLFQSQAQKLKFGPRFGIASPSLNMQDIDDWQDVAISLQDQTPEYQAGLFARLQLGGLYIQPEFLFSTSSAKFLVEDLIDGGSEIMREQYYNVEIPVMAGLKLGPFRAQGGPVYRMNLGNSSDFFTREGFGRNFKGSEVGIQAGIGLDLGKKIALDLKYELPMDGSGDEISLFGQTHTLSDRGTHLVASVGFSF